MGGLGAGGWGGVWVSVMVIQYDGLSKRTGLFVTHTHIHTYTRIYTEILGAGKTAMTTRKERA
jgi:hypothetical protein